jgi:chromosome segregation ATPase
MVVTPSASTEPSPKLVDAKVEVKVKPKEDAPTAKPLASGLLGKLAKLVTPKGAKETAAPKPADKTEPEPTAKPEAAVAAPQSEPAEVAEAATSPELAGPAEQVPSLPDRIAALQKNRSQVEARITEHQAEIERLDKDIKDLEARRDAARNEAQQAELKMLEAERNGAKSTDPEAVQKFVNEYRKLAEAQRKAAREAATLEEGSMRNVKAAADPEDILSAPLAAADASKPMQPERGLVALRSDKAVAQASLAASKELLVEIDRQIEQLTVSRKAIDARMAELQAAGAKLRAELDQYAQSAARQVVRADQLEKEAIETAEGQGMQAAQRAQSAANAFQSATAQFIRSENPTETPDRKLSEMAADQFTVANAVLLQGDLGYLLARTYLQQANDLKVHEQMLRELAGLSVEVKLNADQLPEGVTAESVPAAATNADEAAKAQAEDLKKAAEFAKQALENYTQAASQLKDLWVVHANMAAVHNLLADLPRVEGDNEDHLALARDTYARAIQGREKQPEYAAYRRIVDSLKPQVAK